MITHVLLQPQVSNLRIVIRAGNDSIGSSTPNPNRSEGRTEGNGANNSTSKKCRKVAAKFNTIALAKFRPGHYHELTFKKGSTIDFPPPKGK
jgi:hypothetical protein